MEKWREEAEKAFERQYRLRHNPEDVAYTLTREAYIKGYIAGNRRTQELA